MPQPADSLAALARDSVGFTDRFRADTTWFVRASDPGGTARSFNAYVQERVLDPGLWIGVAGALFRVALILLAARLLLQGVERLARRYVGRTASLNAIHPRRQHAATVANLVVSAARYAVWPLALITALGQVGLDVRALLATAGIAGLAIGFGAQTLVRDLISGVFLLFDDSIHVGDTVRIGADEGTVEYIGVRLIKVRRFNGELLMVPAGELRVFGNRSIGFARAVVDVALPYSAPLRTLLEALRTAVQVWATAHPEFIQGEPPEVQGITELADPGARARIVVTTPPGQQGGAERSLRLAVLDALAEAGYAHASTVAPPTPVPPPAPLSAPRGSGPATLPDV